jgi:hypothetical protein
MKRRDLLVWLGALILSCLMAVAHAASVSPASLALLPGEAANVTIGNIVGKSKVTLSNSDSKVASAKLTGSTIRVTALKVGSTTLTIKDQNITSTVAVSVMAPMTVTPTSLSLQLGASATLTASNAAGALNATSSSGVASASVSGASVLVTGLAGGSATVTVSDGKTSVAVAVTVIAPPPPPPPPGSNVVPAALFGLHIHNAAGPVWPAPVDMNQATAWPTPAFGSWRLWDADVTWPQLEAQRGQWDFSRLDAYVAMAEQRGVEIVLPLGLSPSWASARPREASSYWPGSSAEPANIDDWRNYVRTVATRYAGRVMHYEIWNEVNEPGYFTGSVATMVNLVREARLALLAVDPRIKVISPSVVGGQYARDWLNSFFAAGGGAHVDIVGYHFYVHDSTPEAMLALIDGARQVMAAYGLQDKELWNTETGWLIDNEDGTPNVSNDPYWPVLAPETAAGFVIRAYALAHVNGLKRFHWYSWDGGNIGLLNPASKTPKQAGLAYARAMDWLLGANLERCDAAGTVWSCPLTRADGTSAYLAWTQDGAARSWIAPSGFAAARYLTRDGVSHNLAASTSPVPINGTPVLVLAP